MSTPETGFCWSTQAFHIEFEFNELGAVCLGQITPIVAKGADGISPGQFKLPLTDIRIQGLSGNTSIKTAKSLIGGQLSSRLKYDSHSVSKNIEGKGTETLEIRSLDDDLKILVTVHLTAYGTLPVLRFVSTVTNNSQSSNTTVTQLSSITIGGLTEVSPKWYDEYKVMTASNGWFREAQWQEHTLPDVGIDNAGICELPDTHAGSQAIFGRSNKGSFSTGSHLPMGVLTSTSKNKTWLWQIEHNGSWRWEIGDVRDQVYLSAGGPNNVDHAWQHSLGPGETFTSVPVSIVLVEDDVEAAFAAITDYRRSILRPHKDNEQMPIIFNDYMNCLMGDPDEGKITALLEPVAESGAQFFVIDAGWYADDSNWWDDVGLWQPSQKRFPSGFATLLDKIRAHNLTPGLWLEPEVIGVRSIVAQQLPSDAFFQESGQRIIERARFQLDYRSPHVISWMNEVVRRLVVDLGIGFFKFDYNIEVIQGTDIDGPASTGRAHLEHQRAYLAWVNSLLDTYPHLVIESCSSGAQRMDYAMLSVHSLQSTSDQQNPTMYAAIAAALPTAVLPEQSGTWAYPQTDWSDELIAFTIINSLLGRVYLSGRLDQLSRAQLDLVYEGMRVYQDLRKHLSTAHATWPLGLPQWHDHWVALGMVTREKTVYLAVWRRGGPTKMTLSLRRGMQQPYMGRVSVVYPVSFETRHYWNASEHGLELELPQEPSARLLKIS